jgi:hypothetical protein
MLALVDSEERGNLGHFNFFTATDHEATFAIAKQTDIYSLIDC